MKKIFKSLIFFLVFWVLFLVSTSDTSAQATVNCRVQLTTDKTICDEIKASLVDPSHIIWENGVCYYGFVASCPKPGNFCCRPGDYDTSLCSQMWDYAHNPVCVGATYDPERDISTYQCQWSYEHCGAGDRCPPCSGSGGPEAVCAGICADSGCVTGGWYKTCCQVSGAITIGARLTGVPGTCVGEGGCSGTNVARVRWANFDSPGPSCSNTLCLQSWDGWSWVVDTCTSGPTVTPGGATSEPTPTAGPAPPQPGTFCGGCDDYWSCDWGGSGGCSVGPCERLYYGYGPDPCPATGAIYGGDCCTWCYSKAWGRDCGSASPAKPSLYSPANGASVDTSAAEFRWYKYQGGEDGKCGDCEASGKNNCWGFMCARESYTIYVTERRYELFVSRVANLTSSQAASKNPSHWGSPRVVVKSSNSPAVELLVKGESGYVAPDWVSRTIDLEVTTPGTYWWFVRACNPDGCRDSSLRSFNYCAQVPPGAATCTSPNNEQIIETSIVLDWNAPASWGEGCPTTKSYEVLLNEEGGAYPPTSLVCTSNTPASEPTSTCNYSGLVFGKLYYWRVKTINNPTSPTGFSYSNTCFFMVREPGPWWQTTDGDVHAQGAITSLIPGCATTEKYLSLTGPGGFPGVVSWGGDSPPSLEKGAASSLDWQANDLNRRPKVGFEYLANRLNLDKSKVFSGDLSATADGTYYVDATSGAYSLNGAALGTSKIVLFVEGDVKVLSSITVSPGGFFALVSKGRITFDASMAQTDGFYLADGVIDTSFAKTAFKGYGSFVAWGGFNLQRDLSNGTTGGCTPSELFYARPDLYLNAPKEFMITPSFFQELTP